MKTFRIFLFVLFFLNISNEVFSSLENTQWNEAYSSSSDSFYDVWGLDENNIFAVGQDGVIVYFNGSFWYKMQSNSDENLWSIWGNSKNNIFTVGSKGAILHYNGHEWSKMESGTNMHLFDVWGSSDDNVIAVGADSILQYNGEKWSKIDINTYDTTFFGVWGLDENNIYAVGDSGGIFHYNGSQWIKMETNLFPQLWSVWGYDEKNVFAVGGAWGQEGTILHFNGTDWERMTSGVFTHFWCIWGTDSDNIYAVADSGIILNYDGQSWKQINSDTSNRLRSIWGYFGTIYTTTDKGKVYSLSSSLRLKINNMTSSENSLDKMSISLNNTDSINVEKIELLIEYDNTVLDAESAALAGEYSTNGYSIKMEKIDSNKISIEIMANGNSIASTGDVFNINFNVKSENDNNIDNYKVSFIDAKINEQFINITNGFFSFENSTPTITSIPDQKTYENIENFEIAFSVDDKETAPENLSITVYNSNNSLISVNNMQIVNNGAEKILKITPNKDCFGSATIIVKASDGRKAGFSAFKFIVESVNNAPCFTKNADIVIVEDSSSQSIEDWAKNISVGPENESDQNYWFNVTNDHPGFFTKEPVITNNILSFTPAPDVFGEVKVDVVLQDDGGTDFGGKDSSEVQSFLITILSINDPPQFEITNKHECQENSGLQSIQNFSKNINAGNFEDNQNLQFIVKADKSSLFSTQPKLSNDGTLTYCPAADTTGSSLVNVVLVDDGGKDNNGIDVSKQLQFIINIFSDENSSKTINGNERSLDDENTTISGRIIAIINDRELSIENASISLTSNNNDVLTQTTDSQGAFEFSEIDKGFYNISIGTDYFEKVNFEIEKSDGNFYTDIILEKSIESVNLEKENKRLKDFFDMKLDGKKGLEEAIDALKNAVEILSDN